MPYNKFKKVGEFMNYCTFGEQLKLLRKSKNMTQKELGAKIGLSKAVVSKYENGMGYPSFDVLIRIAQHFGVTTDFLLGITGKKYLDVSQLSDSQMEVLRLLVAEFSAANRN